jgi:hypothetical protein
MSVISRQVRSVGVAAAVSAASVAIGVGCGERDEPEVTTTTPPVERAEKVRKLPHRWEVERNRKQGFALGVPPGWKRGPKACHVKDVSKEATVMCSPDRLITLTITADRTDEALELSTHNFAVEVMAGISRNYQRPLDAGKAKPFEAHYDGAKVGATGRAATGVREDVSVIVLRREGLVTITAVVAAHATRATGKHKKFAERALRTLRTKPVS